MPGHHQFNYKFSEDNLGNPTEGISFGYLEKHNTGEDLRISWPDYGYTDQVAGRCSRWDINEYTVTVETWLTRSELQSLRNHIVPGATEELYEILNVPKFYDKTWSNSNTLKFTPIGYTKRHFGIESGENDSNLPYMREEVIIYVKSIGEHVVTPEYLNVKIEGYMSGSFN